MPFWRTYFHAVWATKGRQDLITPQIEARLLGAIRATAERAGVAVHAINGTGDHVHVVMSVPPTIALAVLIGQIKGASAHLVNRELASAEVFSWGDGYGLFTLGPRQLPTAVAYVQSQKQHHAQKTTNAALEQVSDD